MSFTEKLIDSVYSYPILYDSSHKDFKNLRKRDRAWDELGKQLDQPGETVKKKWKNMKDTYAKHLRSFGPINNHTKNYSSWQWASRMEMYKPFLTTYKGDSNDALVLEDFVNDDGAESTESNKIANLLENSLNYTHEANVIIKTEEDCDENVHKKPRVSDYESCGSKVVKYLANEGKEELDAVDHFMIGFAKTMKSFSPKRLTETKMEIARIIFQKEMEQIEEDNGATRESPVRRGRNK